MSPQPRPLADDHELGAILDRAFKHHAGASDTIDLHELQKALGLRNAYLAHRTLTAFDTDGDGTVSKREFVTIVRALIVGTDREKLEFAFKVHDHDGDGALGHDDLLRMITVSLTESEIAEKATQSPEQLTRALLKRADKDGDDKLSFAEFEAAVSTHPELLWKMTRNEATWIAPKGELLDWVDARAVDATSPIVSGAERNRAPAVVLALWVVVNAALFAWPIVRGLGTPGARLPMLIGRATGLCLDLNGALILVPMMRKLLTRLRATWLGRVVPFDESIELHKFVGHALAAFAVVHAAAFITAYSLGHIAPVSALLFAHRRGLTGVALIGVTALMWIFSLAFIRRSQRFELFYFTHLLYFAWFPLAIAHAPAFAFWAGVPILGFVIEQLLRLGRRAPASAIVSLTALRSGVTRVEVARPPGFQFGPGDYAFVRIPGIARGEWHPFTISSAPEQPNLTFHVRSLGNWTTSLRRAAESSSTKSGEGGEGGENALRVAYVDGPYGSPSAHIFDSQFAVLIGAGIGVTPFASVLESIVLRGNGQSVRPSKLKRVHFFWLNRDQLSFEWFGALLHDLENEDKRWMLEPHLCMTGARSGAASMALELARDAMHAAGRSDLVTGLRSQTHVGPPDWEKMLGAIASKHTPERVDVYFCGPPALADKLRPICERLRMTFREERF